MRGVDRAALETLHARAAARRGAQPLHPDPVIARELQPYERQTMAHERLMLPPPVVQAKPPEKPLPLPGGPQHGVEPIPPQSTRD